MTVSATFPILPRVWRGWADPGLPVGVYIAAGSVTGNASGGLEFIDFIFSGEGLPTSGRFYNIEQITTHVAIASAVVGGMVAVNWDETGAITLADRLWAIQYASDGVGGSGLNSAGWALGGAMPIFLGQPHREPDVATSVLFQQPNVLGTVLFATIQGYIWEPRSTVVDGGLRRPVEALYG